MSSLVLLVEVSKFGSLEERLKQRFYQLEKANSYSKALTIIKKTSFDLIIININSISSKLFSFCHFLQSTEELNDIPIIISCESINQNDQVKLIDLGVADFISNEVSQGYFFSKIRSLLHVKNWIQEKKQQINADIDMINYLLVNDQTYKNNLIITVIYEQEAIFTEVFLEFNQINLNKIQHKEFDMTKLNHLSDIVIIDCSKNFALSLERCVKIYNYLNQRKTSIIVIIDQASQHLIADALELGITDYIIYPFDVEILQAKIKQQIKHSSNLTALDNELNFKIRLGLRDHLTGLFNKASFKNQLFKLLNSSNKSKYLPISLIIFDIDDFKKINDTYGHLAGDQLLQKISQIMLPFVNKNNILARFGGEEFVILLTNKTAKQAEKLANEIRSAVEKTNQVTISGGVTTLTTIKNLEEIFNFADRALYQAKNSGKNKVFSLA